MLEDRTARQIPTLKKWGEDDEFTETLKVGKKKYIVKAADKDRAETWMAGGFTEAMKTPGGTIVFDTVENAANVRKDQKDCMGCLSACAFSNWSQNPDTKYSLGKLADPRSFCIQKTLMDIAHGGKVENNLMFAGHGAYNFAIDPFYSNGFVPTVQELIDRIQTGD
jgi:hypothetical protein